MNEEEHEHCWNSFSGPEAKTLPFNAGVWVLLLVKELRSHLPGDAAKM